VINVLRYLIRSGCEWRMLPNDFPPYQTVYYWFRRLMRRFLFRTVHDLALMLDRTCEQREVVPSAGIVDSQSVKAPGARERGYDAHKKISGRKRHITVDTDGSLLAVDLTPADIAESARAQFILDALVKRCPWGQTPVRRCRL
jgi:transposase